MSSYSASAAKRRGSVVPPLAGVERPEVESIPDKCDVLIYGTGIVEGILAAALAWQGTNVVHVGPNPYYGDNNAVLNLDQLQAWVSNVNDPHNDNAVYSKALFYMPRPLKSRDYLVDLSPKIMFARSDLIDLLVKARVWKYLEFKQIGSFHTFENDSFDKVASSKEAIFTDQHLSLLTKRGLMRFLKFVLNWEAEPEVWKDYTTVSSLLTDHFKLDQQQVKELVFSIGLCTTSETPVKVGLARIKRYVVSLDVYGNFPALFSMYGGAGEISQGFCRSAAVAGATYKLSSRLTSYEPSTGIARFADGFKVHVAEKFVSTVPPSSNHKNELNRLTAIVRKDCKEWFAENESAAVVVFPPGTVDNKIAVQALVFGSGSGQCPEGQAIWYLSTTEKGAQARRDLEKALEKLEVNILRESTEDFEIDADEDDVQYRNDGLPVVSSVKLGKSMQNFVPKEKLQYLLKLGYTQYLDDYDYANHLVEPQQPKEPESESDEDVLYVKPPSAEISYDGIVAEAKALYSKIVGTDEDFFDVDFEDDEPEEKGHEQDHDDLDMEL